MAKPTISEQKKRRMDDSVAVRKIPLDMSDPHPEFNPFERHIVAVYGVPGVGKSKFVEELGSACNI